MTTMTETTTQVYSVYIKAAPQAIWDAITRPEWTERFGYGGRSEYDLRPGGAYRGLTSELTVVHELEGAPGTAGLLAGEMEDQGAGGGWNFVLSSLKTLLETGDSFVH